MLIISENTRDTLQYLHLFPQKMNQFLTFLAELQAETVELKLSLFKQVEGYSKVRSVAFLSATTDTRLGGYVSGGLKGVLC